MDPASLDIIAPMVVAIILFITIGGVILLKPIANNLGQLLKAMAKEREEPGIGSDILRIRELLETMNGRISLLEDRQDFTEALLADPERQRMRLKRGEMEEEED